MVLRPKPHSSVSQDFRPNDYDILLTEQGSVSVPGLGRTMKQLPKTNMTFEEEPMDALCTFLFNMTGGAFGGLKGTSVHDESRNNIFSLNEI